eukprot:15466213-Alexandrium_andersonii.AAC.1
MAATFSPGHGRQAAQRRRHLEARAHAARRPRRPLPAELRALPGQLARPPGPQPSPDPLGS